MPPRRANAPRLIEWTGERAVPWAPGVQTFYEHLHRYYWAQRMAEGRRVLDLASGEGFGAALLADVATSVTGVELDPSTVEHSRLNYQAPNLDFRRGSADDLGAFADGSFDLVTAFEMIEHVSDQDTVLAEIARVLTPEGLLVMSTPDRCIYTQATGYDNPYHVRELSRSEFEDLLRRRFSEVAMYGQRAAAGTRIELLGAETANEPLMVNVERSGEDWRPTGPMAPVYLIAVASRGIASPPGNSVLSDFGMEVVREVQVDLAASRAREDAAMRECDRLQLEARGLREQLAVLGTEAGLMRRRLDRVEGSVAWRLFDRLSSGFYARIGGRDSRAGRVIGAGLRRFGDVVLPRGSD